MSNDAGQTTTTKKRVSLRTYRPASLKLSSDNPHVKASLTFGPWTGIRRQYAEQEVTIEVEPQALLAGQEQLTATLTIVMDQEAPNKPFEMRVPITFVRSSAP